MVIQRHLSAAISRRPVMRIAQHFNDDRAAWQRQGLLVVVLLLWLLPARLDAAEETTIRPLVAQLIAAGEKYDPQPLVDHGPAGLRVLLDTVFPETADVKKESAAQINALLGQLGDASFKRREDATAALLRLGATSLEVLRQSSDHPDAEIRSRVRSLIAAAEKSQSPLSVNPGLQIYLDKLENLECQQELARRVTLALQAHLDRALRVEALRTCLQALAKWPTERVHAELLPLLKLNDTKPAMFALEQLGLHAGNNYVSALHMGAITSSNLQLVRCAIRTLPNPVSDKINMPKIQAVLEHFFDDSPEYAELRKDSAFLYSTAIVAAREFRMPAARQWLIDKINSGSLKAIQALGDTAYARERLDPELLTALEPHLKSADANFRTVAIRTIGIYSGEAVQPALLRAFADPEKQVWQAAGDCLNDQHSYAESGQPPLPRMLDRAIQTTQDEAYKKRLNFLRQHLLQERTDTLKWPD